MPNGERGPDERELARMEELLWVIEAQGGGSDAFVQLVRRYERPLLYYLRRLVPEGDSALDLHQEVWLDAFRGLPGLQAPEAFRAWLYSIAHHKAARFIRKEVLNGEWAKSYSGEPVEDLGPAVEETLDVEAVHRGLALLPTDQREVLVLHYLRELSTQELAAVLDCPPGTVKSRLHTARLALRRIIERKKL